MDIALLIISCLSGVFSFSFLMSAVLAFATCDQKPTGHDTDKQLSFNFWLGGVALISLLAVAHYWQHSQLGRRLFFTGTIFGVVFVLFGFLAAHGI